MIRIDKTQIYTQLPLRLATLVPDVARVDDDEDGALPAELREWLVRLRLLDSVPFAYLVADTELLPEESIRFFYVDRRWTDALVQGALSVGTINTDDRIQLTAQYGAVRSELDQEERNLRRAPGALRMRGDVGPISGFILRSRAVAGWPALHVRAFAKEPGQSDSARYFDDDPAGMRLLRLERLAPAVLLCLFDGIPKVVHIEEPRQGVQFGFEASPSGGALSVHLRPRDCEKKGEYIAGTVADEIKVPFRPGASGVIDIQQLERRLKKFPETRASDGLDAAEYALQLVRFPFRQVFGEPGASPVASVFKPSIAYAALAKATFRIGGEG